VRNDFQRRAFAVAVILLALGPSGGAAAEPGTIEEIRPLGLGRMTEEAFRFALGVEVGDPYDPEQLRSRFKALWNRKLFEDITFEVEDGPAGGKVLIVKLVERPVLASVSYEDSKVVTRTQIEDRYKERSIDLAVGKPLDRGQVYFAESAIRDLFAEKGYLDAQVRAEIRRGTETSREVHFHMSAGGKTRIHEIDFTGNAVFTDRKLKNLLRLTAERRWWWPWSSKNLYHPIKWDQDVANLRDAYQNQGYLDVEVRAPVVEVREKDDTRTPADAQAPAEEPGSERSDPESAGKGKKGGKDDGGGTGEKGGKQQGAERRWVYLTVPIQEGRQYRLGEVTIVGNEVFGDAVLRPLISLQSGDVLSHGVVEQGVNRITRIYEDRGHLYASVVRQTRRREAEPVADLEISIEEDKPYSVGRIEFRGNAQTQDRVLRREVVLREGDLFSRTLLDLSKTKVNQLGYFQITEEPIIEPIAEDSRVRILLAGEEQSRNEIQVGGGFSGQEGAFFNGVYATRNFLGRGQVVSVSMQIGGRSDRYQLAFQEPWFLGRPYTFGASLFRRDIDYGASLSSTSSGGGILLGRLIKRFSRVTVGYNLENVTSQSFVGGDQVSLFESKFRISSLTPVYTFSTVNNPYRPTRGSSLTLSVQIAGGPLGGTTSFFKPLATLTTYRRAFGRNLLAFHTELGWVHEFGGDGLVTASDIEGVPRFTRFWLGGDTLGPRVFETRTITPRRFMKIDAAGRIVDVVGNVFGEPASSFITSNGVPIPIEVGGDRMYLFQSEFVMPLGEQAELAAFVDIGDALFEDTRLDFTTARVATGVELRFHLPIFPVPLRLIYGFPVRELEADRTSNFTFSIGRSF
jgi:outer membrane protein insertion porin family